LKSKKITPEEIEQIITDQIIECKKKNDIEGLAKLTIVYCRIRNILLKNGVTVEMPKIIFTIEGLDIDKV